MENSNLFTILQICDSAFPTGGFSHSMGCEAAFQNNFIQNEDDLRTFIFGCLENLGSSSVPFLKSSYESFTDHEKLKTLDSLHNSALLNHVAHRASKQQGKSFLNSSHDIFKLSNIVQLKTLVEEGTLHGHLAIIFAAVCASLQIPALESGKIFLFSSLRTIIASLVRLGKVGTIQAQCLQYETANHLEEIILRNWDTAPEEASIAFPITEILQNTHDTLFSKLFYS